MLPLAMIIITAALVFYTIGVWSEYRRKSPTSRDAVYFASGLVCDAIGTSLMMRMSQSGTRVLSPFAHDLMLVSGTAAIALMFAHLAALIVVLRTGWMREKFHLVSVAIWSVWLISYLAGPSGLMIK